MKNIALIVLLSSTLVACGTTSNNTEDKKLSGRQVADKVEELAAKSEEGIKCRHASATGTRLKQTKCTTKAQREKARKEAQRELMRASTTKDWSDTNTSSNF